jgi:hypothetical protein
MGFKTLFLSSAGFDPSYFITYFAAKLLLLDTLLLY